MTSEQVPKELKVNIAMANLNELEEIFAQNGINEIIDNISRQNDNSSQQSMSALPPTALATPNLIGQGIPPTALAEDLGKIYLAIFNEYLIHRYGVHWPMTIYHTNNEINPWDLTLVTPNPIDHRRLPTMDSAHHPLRYMDIKDTLVALADEWSLRIQFL